MRGILKWDEDGCFSSMMGCMLCRFGSATGIVLETVLPGMLARAKYIKMECLLRKATLMEV